MEQTIDSLDELLEYVKYSRSLLPYLPSEAIGRAGFDSPNFYGKYNAQVRFSASLSNEDIAIHNDIAHWLNENCIVRLFAILEEAGIYNSVDGKSRTRPTKKIDGYYVAVSPESWNAFQLTAALRHQIAHGIDDSLSNQTLRKVIKQAIERLLDVQQDYTCDRFSLPIDGVIIPLIQNCKALIAE